MRLKNLNTNGIIAKHLIGFKKYHEKLFTHKIQKMC